MKKEIETFLDKVAEMRGAQKRFFDAKKRHDMTTALSVLNDCKRLEKEVDALLKELIEKLKNGEQLSLF